MSLEGCLWDIMTNQYGCHDKTVQVLWQCSIDILLHLSSYWGPLNFALIKCRVCAYLHNCKVCRAQVQHRAYPWQAQEDIFPSPNQFWLMWDHAFAQVKRLQKQSLGWNNKDHPKITAALYLGIGCNRLVVSPSHPKKTIWGLRMSGPVLCPFFLYNLMHVVVELVSICLMKFIGISAICLVPLQVIEQRCDRAFECDLVYIEDNMSLICRQVALQLGTLCVCSNNRSKCHNFTASGPCTQNSLQDSKS